ncbi:acetyltransferase (GNAT) domain protein, partial [Candidatus Magnetomorum sp. HK-1]
LYAYIYMYRPFKSYNQWFGRDNTMNKIREATIDDTAQVFLLASELATSFVVEYKAFSKSFEHCIHNESSLVLVAEDGEEIIGYLLGYDHYAFFSNGRITGTEEIFVKPEHRGSGIGKALMNKCEKWAKERFSTLSIVVTRRASEFYKSIGYEESAIYFKKDLTRIAEQNAGVDQRFRCAPSPTTQLNVIRCKFIH